MRFSTYSTLIGAIVFILMAPPTFATDLERTVGPGDKVTDLEFLTATNADKHSLTIKPKPEYKIKTSMLSELDTYDTNVWTKENDTYYTLVSCPFKKATFMSVKVWFHTTEKGTYQIILPDANLSTKDPEVKTRVSEQAVTDKNWDRKTVGIGETIKLSITNSNWGAPRWVVSNTSLATVESGNDYRNNTNLIIKGRAGKITVTPKYPPSSKFPTEKDGTPIEFTIKEPSSEIAIETTSSSLSSIGFSFTRLPYSSTPTDKIGAGMYLLVTLQPIDVSFYNVKIWEEDAPSPGTEGFFSIPTNSAYVNSHKASGFDTNLSAKNQWCDTAWYVVDNDNSLSAGKLIWTIPVKWMARTDDTKTGTTIPSRIQTHEIISPDSFKESKTFNSTISKTDSWSN